MPAEIQACSNLFCCRNDNTVLIVRRINFKGLKMRLVVGWMDDDRTANLEIDLAFH